MNLVRTIRSVVFAVATATGITSCTGLTLMKTYRPWNPQQSHLLPPSPSDWLPEGHLVFFILDLVNELDLGAITRVIQTKDARGEKPYSPMMMTALLLYAAGTSTPSSRSSCRPCDCVKRRGW